MHVTRVLIQEHVLIKQVLFLLDRSRQAKARDGTDNITVVALTLRQAFQVTHQSDCPVWYREFLRRVSY
ncbi:MAG: hypothetical protein K9K63_01785 [Desulfotignum sp.]|nr:hypothetical protein [Desulfotignum sp.]MCF8136022.1 hypothetical protein [Desulfotignum sp.]